MKIYRLVTLAGIVLSAAFGAHAQEAKEYVYQVKPGDTLGGLSQELLDSPTRWAAVAKHNKLSDANLIRPGQTLSIPFAWLRNYPAEARIEALTGAVKLNGRAAKVGDAVPAGAVLETPANGSVNMSLPDGSLMNVLEKSKVSAERLDKKQQGNFFSAIFRLITGRIEATKKKYPEGQAPLNIKGAHMNIGVRGTRFRVGQEEGKTLAEVEDGLVSAEAGAKFTAVALAGGQGTVGNGVSQPAAIPLLPAPDLTQVPELFGQPVVNIKLPDMEGAVGYRTEVATDEKFANIVAQTGASGNLLRVPDLSDGTFWLRVRAVDKNGLQGRESQKRFVVKTRPLPPSLMTPESKARIPAGTVPTFTWAEAPGASHYKLQISPYREFNEMVMTREKLSGRTYAAEQPLPVGEYYWRVATVQGEADQGPWSEERSLSVSAPPPPPPAPVAPSAPGKKRKGPCDE